MNSDTNPNLQTVRSPSLLQQIQLDGQHTAPSIWNAVAGVVRYEFVRSLTVVRILIWFALIFFPVALVTAALHITYDKIPGENDSLPLSFLMFILLPQSVTVLSMLLYASPIVNAELESQTWIYAVVRPKARRAILLGKYIVAVMWCGSCTSLATLFVVLVANYYGIDHAEKVIGIQLVLCWLATFSYGALFVAIGTVFQRRAMVYSFAYSILVEALMGWMPAVVNLFTVSYRLRSLLFSWITSHDPKQLEDIPYLWEDAPLKHLAIIALFILSLLAVSVWRIDRNQYRWQSEV